MKRGWHKITVIDNAPSARSSHTVSCVGQKVFVYGGEHTARVGLEPTMFVYDIEDSTWTQHLPEKRPNPRCGHSAVAVNGSIYVFGGRGADKELNDLWAYDVASNTWSEVESRGPKPGARSYQAMEVIGEDIYLFGGCAVGSESTTRFNDLWKFTCSKREWEKIEIADGPTIRGGPGLVGLQNTLLVLFGFNGEELGDCWSFKNAAWSPVMGDLPIARSVFCCCALPDGVFVFGGEKKPSGAGHAAAGTHTNEGYIFNLDSNQWLVIDVAPETPEARGWHACCQIPGGVALFGGLSNENERLGDFYLYR